MPACPWLSPQPFRGVHPLMKQSCFGAVRRCGQDRVMEFAQVVQAPANSTVLNRKNSTDDGRKEVAEGVDLSSNPVDYSCRHLKHIFR